MDSLIFLLSEKYHPSLGSLLYQFPSVMHSIRISIRNLLSVSSSFFSSSHGRTTSITHFPPFVSPRMFSSSTSWTVLPSEDSNLSKPNFRISLSFINEKRKFSMSISYFHTHPYDSSFSDRNGKVVKVKKSNPLYYLSKYLHFNMLICLNTY